MPKPEPTALQTLAEAEEIEVGIRDSIERGRARGERFARDAEGGFRRLAPPELLFDRGAISGRALLGAEWYRLDHLSSKSSVAMRSTLFARVGFIDDEDSISERSFAAAMLLAKARKALRVSARIATILDRFCTAEGSDAAIERAAISVELGPILERLADWYDRNDTRGTADFHDEGLGHVTKEAWWIMARAFNKRMTRAAFDDLYIQSGMAEQHSCDDRRRLEAQSTTDRLKASLLEDTVESRAIRLYEAFSERYRLRAGSWRQLGEVDRRRWREAAREELQRAA